MYVVPRNAAVPQQHQNRHTKFWSWMTGWCIPSRHPQWEVFGSVKKRDTLSKAPGNGGCFYFLNKIWALLSWLGNMNFLTPPSNALETSEEETFFQEVLVFHFSQRVQGVRRRASSRRHRLMRPFLLFSTISLISDSSHWPQFGCSGGGVTGITLS